MCPRVIVKSGEFVNLLPLASSQSQYDSSGRQRCSTLGEVIEKPDFPRLTLI